MSFHWHITIDISLNQQTIRRLKMNDILDSQISLPCRVILKNRICKSALTERIAEGDNLVNQKHLNLYEKWAEGNVGTVLTGNVKLIKGI